MNHRQFPNLQSLSIRPIFKTSTGLLLFPLLNKHFSFAATHPLPLLQQHGDLIPDVLHDEIHLDIIPSVTEWILEPTPDAVDTVERERDQNDDRHRPPVHVVHERKWQDAPKEGEHLFLVDPALGPLSSEPRAQRIQRWERLTGEQ